MKTKYQSIVWLIGYLPLKRVYWIKQGNLEFDNSGKFKTSPEKRFFHIFKRTSDKIDPNKILKSCVIAETVNDLFEIGLLRPDRTIIINTVAGIIKTNPKTAIQKEVFASTDIVLENNGFAPASDEYFDDRYDENDIPF